MNNDLRINLDVFEHIKIERLIGTHGAESFIGLMKIWRYAANIESVDGLLAGFTSSDIAVIAKIKDSEFGDNLVKLGLLEKVDEGYKIHNWRRHNPWCCESRSRSESARNAANTRWGKTRTSSDNKS